MDFDTKTFRIKDFGAQRKENSAICKTFADLKMYLDTGLNSQLVSLDGIESYDEFWDRIDTLFFSKHYPNIIPKHKTNQSRSTTSVESETTKNSTWFNVPDLRDRLLDSLIPEDFEASNTVKTQL
jgi:hypothetical protein